MVVRTYMPNREESRYKIFDLRFTRVSRVSLRPTFIRTKRVRVRLYIFVRSVVFSICRDTRIYDRVNSIISNSLGGRRNYVRFRMGWGGGRRRVSGERMERRVEERRNATYYRRRDGRRTA